MNELVEVAADEIRYIVGKTEYDMIHRIKSITNRGNDAEIRRKKDGSLVVYEVKKISVK